MTKEIDLYETNRKINEDLEEIIEKKSTKYEVINVLSNFQRIGTEVKGVTKNYVFLLGCFGSRTHDFMVTFKTIKHLFRKL
jgi:hypothetical protein